MSRPKNAVVAQSAGPTPVINNSLRGVIEACREMSESFGTVYAGRHGIEGVLREELLDLSAQDRGEIALPRTTPAAGATGTCRYKLRSGQDEDLERIVEVLRAHDVGYFFYIGGNDSMDTAHKVALLAHDRGLDLVATGVPKTIDNDVGDIGERRDAFGHTTFSSSEMTVGQIVVNHLNRIGLPCRGTARGNVPGTDQRDSVIHASTVGSDEAYLVGRQAACIAARDGSGFMATILREPGPGYRVRYDKVPLEAVANSERSFPEGWITPSRTDVTDEFLQYARPLVGNDWPSVPLVDGLQRFARLAPVFADKKLPDYRPQAYRR